MKKLLSLMIVVMGYAVNVCAMERGENVAPVLLTQEELGRRLRQEREARQAQARRMRDQQRQAGQYRGAQQNLNAQMEDEVGRGDMDVEF